MKKLVITYNEQQATCWRHIRCLEKCGLETGVKYHIDTVIDGENTYRYVVNGASKIDVTWIRANCQGDFMMEIEVADEGEE